MGVTVREKPKGSGVWWVFINDKGERQAKRIGSKTAATKVQKEIEVELARNAFRISRKDIPTFQKYAENWLENVAKLSLKNSTYASYKCILEKRVFPTLGARPLDAITPKHISDLTRDAIKKGLRSSSALNMKNCLSSIFREAVTPDAFITVNPCRGVRVPVPEGEQASREPDPLTRDERDRLEKVFREHHPYYYPLVVLGFRTGLRIGELIALQWGDIDLDQRLLLVQRNITRGKVTTPKSKASRRLVRLTSHAVEALKRHRKVMMEWTLKRGWQNVPEWLFTASDGKPIDYANFSRRVWTKAVAKAGLRRRTCHDMRHTFATMRLSNGDPLAHVSKELGHSTPTLTFRSYYKWMPSESTGNVDDLDGINMQPRRNQTI